MISLDNLTTVLSLVDQRINEYDAKVLELAANKIKPTYQKTVLYNLTKLKGVLENEIGLQQEDT